MSGLKTASEVLAPVSHGWQPIDHYTHQLEAWLRRKLPDAHHLRIADVGRPGGSGVANETLLLTTTGWPGPSGLVVRVGSPDYWYIERELRVHWRLYRQFELQHEVPTPRVLGSEDDTAALGQPFFVMERLPGRAPTDEPNYNKAGWLAEATPAHRRKVWQSGVEALAAFHRASAVFGREPFNELRRPGRGDSGLSQALHYWRAYCDDATTGRPHPVLEAAWEWLLAQQPDEACTTLAWGDARLGNLLFDDDARVTGLLDWDLTSLAGAEADLAWWLLMDVTNSRGAGVPMLPGLGGREETIALWETAIGRRAEHLHYHQAFAAFRLGAILIKLADFLSRRRRSTPERERLRTDNYGTQILASMLGLPVASPPLIEWRDCAG